MFDLPPEYLILHQLADILAVDISNLLLENLPPVDQLPGNRLLVNPFPVSLLLVSLLLVNLFLVNLLLVNLQLIDPVDLYPTPTSQHLILNDLRLIDHPLIESANFSPQKNHIHPAYPADVIAAFPI